MYRSERGCGLVPSRLRASGCFVLRARAPRPSGRDGAGHPAAGLWRIVRQAGLLNVAEVADPDHQRASGASCLLAGTASSPVLRPSIRALLLAMLAALACLLLAAGQRFSAPAWGAEAGSPPRGSLEERRAVGKLLSEFSGAGRDLKRRAELVAEAQRQGEAFVEGLYNAIGRELYPQLERYRQTFYAQASALAGKRVGQMDLEEVARLRQTVLGLQARPDFAKELIVRHADPALKRLSEIFVIDRDEVLAASENLQADRQRLAELGGLWEQCAIYLYQQLPDDENKPAEAPSFEQYLQGEEALAAGLAAPMSPQTRQVLAANAALAARLDAEEARAILATNLIRNLLGLPALMIDLRLCAAARDHSQDMERLKFFSHDSPVPGKATPWDRAKLFGTSASGENIAAGYRDGAAATTGWFHSPGHHKNMLGEHARIGVGRAGRYFTQMFGK